MNSQATKQVCVLGYPIAQSLSPRLHNYWYKKHDINAEYTAQEVPPEQLETYIKKLERERGVGCNLTIPHKEKAVELVNEIDQVAQRIGAINTIIIKEGKIIGSNTDAYGFIENIKYHQKNISAYMQHAVVLGAGGAARAVIAGLKAEGCHTITIVNRTYARAEALAAQYGCACAERGELDDVLDKATMLVNTTTIGMEGGPLQAIDLNALNESALVTDIVYKPLKTPLLKEAEVRGNPTVDGIGMLIFQAQKSVEHWFGVKPEVDDTLFTYMKVGPIEG